MPDRLIRWPIVFQESADHFTVTTLMQIQPQNLHRSQRITFYGSEAGSGMLVKASENSPDHTLHLMDRAVFNVVCRLPSTQALI